MNLEDGKIKTLKNFFPIKVLSCGFLMCLLIMLIACERNIAGGSLDGAVIYSEGCARCHGPNGVPDQVQVARLNVKNLTDPLLRKRLSIDDIANQVLYGSTNQKMPSFANVLTKAQAKQVAHYVYSLSSPTPR